MKKVDLHVHSKYSNHPSEWFLQKIGASESYTEPEFIYNTAKSRGMNFVTITDHNNISGAIELNKRHPKDTFVSVESTVYFPEDGGKVHILIYDITKEQFEKIQILRQDIYQLRDYIKENDLAYSVAHATYSVNETLTINHLEKLTILFDCFEVINGGRGERSNSEWEAFLRNLNSNDIDKLEKKYNIKPFSNKPWIKGFTGGSDDHAGVFIARTYTKSECETVSGFINNLKFKTTTAEGRYNNFQGLAFSIYKIAYDFAKLQSENITNGFIDDINRYIFEDKKMSFRDKLKLRKLKGEKKRGKKIKGLIGDLIEELVKYNGKDIEKKFEVIYEKSGDITDELIRLLVMSTQKHLKKGNIYNAIKDVSSSISGFFLFIPFVTTFQHMFNTRGIVSEFRQNIEKNYEKPEKRILWFTDTLVDLNGVAVTLNKFGWVANSKKKNLQIVTSLTKEEMKNEGLAPNIMNLKCIESLNLPYYEDYKMRVPSFLSSLAKVYEFDPDEIYISTPGTIGLLGLMFSKLLNLKCTGVYHTDFTAQSQKITNNNSSLMNGIESYTRWFFSNMDEIKVPTSEYIKILSDRDFDLSKLTLFKRGIDVNAFKPCEARKNEDKINLLYVGRISKDKNIDFILEIFKELKQTVNSIELDLVGNGPDLKELKNKYKDIKGINFVGRVSYDKLPKLYQKSDIFVFPSETDTFGRVVLEACACGIPSIVSSVGGPKEIISASKSGFIVEKVEKKLWKRSILKMVDILRNDENHYKKMSKNAREIVLEEYTWNKAIEDIFKD